jgi:hypothetical protein
LLYHPTGRALEAPSLRHFDCRPLTSCCARSQRRG